MKAEAKSKTAAACFRNRKAIRAAMRMFALASTYWFACGCNEAPPGETKPATVPFNSSESTAQERLSQSTPPAITTQSATESVTESANTSTQPQSPVETEKQFDPERLKFAMVAVGTSSDGWFGYGVVIDRSSTGFDVITADHVLAGRTSMTIRAWQGPPEKSQLQTFSSVTVMHRSPDKDLAWLRVRAADSQVLPLSIAKPAQLDGQSAWTYEVEQQRPLFARHEIEKLITAQRNNQAVPVAYVRLKKRIEPGLSGGGLINTKGDWIGIASGNGGNQAHYVAPSEIIAFLKEAGLK